jgi:hypothetical protein
MLPASFGDGPFSPLNIHRLFASYRERSGMLLSISYAVAVPHSTLCAPGITSRADRKGAGGVERPAVNLNYFWLAHPRAQRRV